MVIRKIAHIGVAVKNVDEVEKFFSEILGLPITGREVSPDNKVAFHSRGRHGRRTSPIHEARRGHCPPY